MNIIFDLDSTLATIEGLDWIAEHKGKGEEVKKLTDLAMNGEVKMEAVFAKKVDLIAPSAEDFEKLGKKYCESLVEDAQEVIAALQHLNHHVFMVTGNFKPSAYPVADMLNIPRKNVTANDVWFNEDGSYKGFDFNSPVARSGGKAEVVQKLEKKPGKTIFIGDGFTDAETKPFVDLFIGFGGVAKRDNVKKIAEVYIETSSLAPILLHMLTKEEIEQLKISQFKQLIIKGEKWL